MTAYRRILKAFWFSAALSIILSVVIVATSVLDKTCPVVAAASGNTAVAAEKAVTPTDNVTEPPPLKVTGRARADQDTDIQFDTGKVKLHVPRGAVGGEVEIEMIDHGQQGPEGSGMLRVLDLNAYNVAWGQVMTTNKITKFKKVMTISIKHEPEELAGLDVDTLKLCYLDEESGQWIPLSDSRFDWETNTLSATTDHFSYYAEVANPAILGPGKVMAFLNDLHSGAATASYPIEVPPGSGGFQPSIKLIYNSASIDEMKNKRSVGSWVGIGWSLGLGSISYDAGSNEYLLSLDGASYYQLVQDAQGKYRTTPESFYKIARTGQQWDVYDREGNYYRFGGTADSQQYLDSCVYYRWDLSYIRDTNTANAITVSYVQDNYTDTYGKTHIRSAYPLHVQYNNGHVDIQFNSSHDGADPFRNDNPRTPTPKVVENRKLDSIEVKVDGGWARKYTFAYNTTARYQPSGYGEDYAGRHTLTSITEIGADGTTALPATTFTYADGRIYHYDDDQLCYGGNPGNPASLYWPYLATVANGYGATVTYSYTEEKGTTWDPTHTWTRNAVTDRTVNPGIGLQQDYQYTYYGGPQYRKVGPGTHAWNDEYRGFSQVKEADAQGNYTEHYFWTATSDDDEPLTGKEYKTEWYDSQNQLLDTKEFTWDYRYSEVLPAPLESGAVGYWKFDENGGQTITDSSTGGNNGYLGQTSSPDDSDPSWVTRGRFGSALSFDGQDDRVTIPGSSSLSLTSNFTLSAWVYCGIQSFGSRGGIVKWGSLTSVPYELSYRYADSDSIRIEYGQNFNISGLSYESLVTSYDSVPVNRWTHVAVVYSDRHATIYINGEVKASADFQNNPAVVSGAFMEIGRSLDDGYHYYKGRIDDVRIHNRALAGAEVMTYPLTAAYNFDEDTPGVTGQNNVQIDDVSGCGNVGKAKSNGTLEWTNGISGSAIAFSGDDWVQVPCQSNLPYLDLTTNFTIEAWVYPTADTWSGIIDRGCDDNSSYEIWHEPGNRISYRQNWHHPDNWDFQLFTPNNSVPLNQWSHIAVVYADKYVKIYINGQLMASGTAPTNPVVVGTGYFEMGCNHIGPNPSCWEFYQGRIDNVRVYARAISGEEVLSHAATVAYNFNEGTPGLTGRNGLPINDVSGCGNDGAAGSFSSGTFDWTNGITGSAMVFSNDDWVKMPNTALNGLTDFTFECWIKTTGSGDGIITAARSSQDNEFLVYSQGNITVHVKGSSVATGITLSDGNWHQLAVTRSGSTVKVYKDGVLGYNWSSAPTGALVVDPNGLWLGQEQDSVGGGWDSTQGLVGSLDHVRIYARVLSAEEVGDHAALATFNFNEGQLDTVGQDNVQIYDASGLGHNGMAKSNATFEWVSGRNGAADSSDTAIHFSGDDWVQVPATARFDLTTYFTIEAWVYPTADTWGGIISRASEYAASYDIWHDPGNKISYRQNWTLGTQNYDFSLYTPDNSVPLNQWTHIRVVHTDKYTTIYINGQPVASGGYQTNPGVIAGGWFEIGCNHCGGSPPCYEFYQGRIDDVRIYANGSNGPIDVGAGAIDRTSTVSSGGCTDLDMANPANADGYLTSISFWFNTAATGVRVGTYYLVSSSTFKCRASATIGSVAAGSKQTFTQDSSGKPLSLQVKAGDLIGWYVASGALEKDSSGAGIRYISGEYIDPGDQASYSTATGYGVSIYGQGIGAYDGSEIARLAQAGKSVPFVYLKEVTDTIGSKTSRTRYEYDAYGNVIKECQDGDTSISTDDSVIERDYYPNTSANILSCVAAERVKDGSGNTKKETLYYYDGNNTSVSTPPTKGNLTRVEQKKGDGGSVSTYATYDSYGNKITETDANGNVWQTTWEPTYHTFPETITSPITSQYETYSFDAKTGNLLSRVDVNGQTTTYEYDTFGHLTKIIKPGDSSTYPTVEYQYNNWGTPNQQHLKTLTRITGSDYIWSSQYFDGLGRVVQTQARGETGRTIIASSVDYNNCGLVGKEYVSLDLDSSQVNGYFTPTNYNGTSYIYDGLGRVTSTTAADGTVTSTDYSVAWQSTVTNPRGYKHRYYYDAFGRLTKVDEFSDSYTVYATTTYTYDALGNLKQVVDANGNTSTMNYDWLSRKTSMTDPDMGSWSYAYDSNGNLTSQTDAKTQTVTFAYDALNRLTGKTYPAGSGMTNVTYTFDSISGGNYGKGRRTGMTDASGASAYKYDARGRVIEEKRTVDGVDYATGYTYDSADRLVTVVYPTGETVTQTYNGRGLSYGLSGTVAGNLVTQTLYNQLGQINRIDFGNSVYTTYTYWGLDTSNGYYGRLWEIKTKKSTSTLHDVTYEWDANGNLTQRRRVDSVPTETETFSYDFLDRLASAQASLGYSNAYSYDKIGNIVSVYMWPYTYNYTYGSKPHAVTAVGSTSYAYDANGNMTTRGSQTLTWDVENRLISVTGDGASMSAVYDGDGNRVKKTEGGEAILYGE